MSKTKNKVIDDHNSMNADSLELTPQSEIRRLNQVIEEKNILINDFKRYDELQKVYVRRLEKQIITLRIKNQELNKRTKSNEPCLKKR